MDPHSSSSRNLLESAYRSVIRITQRMSAVAFENHTPRQGWGWVLKCRVPAVACPSQLSRGDGVDGKVRGVWPRSQHGQGFPVYCAHREGCEACRELWACPRLSSPVCFPGFLATSRFSVTACTDVVIRETQTWCQCGMFSVSPSGPCRSPGFYLSAHKRLACKMLFGFTGNRFQTTDQ